MMWTPSKYVLIGFGDGDMRVYDYEGALNQIAFYSRRPEEIQRTWLAEGDDKELLITMAKLGRTSKWDTRDPDATDERKG
jgi:hypothetical protein